MMMLDKNVNVITQNSFIICNLTMLYLRILADTDFGKQESVCCVGINGDIYNR